MGGPDATTVSYYDDNASAFAAGTLGASMGETIGEFATMVVPGGRVLDWGCGSGRDSKVLRDLGFEVFSTDASSAMCEKALRATGTIVRHESFDELAEVDFYDGIWACASLLHVVPDDLPKTFGRAASALVTGGVLYCSFKYGATAGYRHGRWFTDLDEGALETLLVPRFDVARLWVSRDVRPERGDERWVNCLATRR